MATAATQAFESLGGLAWATDIALGALWDGGISRRPSSGWLA